MTNFFFAEQSYSYEPVIKTLDTGVVEKDLDSVRQKILTVIREQIKQKDFSRSEVAFATRMSSSTVGSIMKGNIDKVSTDRLLRIARRLGLRCSNLKFVVEQ
jgi:predicted XRE-type DNA-binding protein